MNATIRIKTGRMEALLKRIGKVTLAMSKAERDVLADDLRDRDLFDLQPSGDGKMTLEMVPSPAMLEFAARLGVTR